ncbi:MAG: ACT domain-containing protein [Deltaproteobacteria bacterium]
MVEQISVFLENKSGTLKEVTETLAIANINIRTLSMADTADFGILRLIVDNLDKTIQILKENGFTVSRTQVVAVEVPDQAGGLAKILAPLKSAGINIEYLYAFVKKSGQNAVIIFRFDDPTKAIATLQGNGLTVLDGEKLYNL